MGWIRKKVKQVGRGIKKIGKKIGKAFKAVLKPFAKVFNKLGPIGSLALGMFLPGIGTALAGWGASMGNVVGTMIKFVGNAINYVATAPKKIFGTITDALGASWNTLTGAAQGTWKPGSWFGNFSNQMQERIAGDGWFGGSSGSWTSFDTTGNILPSGSSFTGEEAGNVMQQDGGQWVETLPDGSVGQPLSKANIDFMNAQATPAITPDLVSDGTVDFAGDVDGGTYVDSITRKPLKLNKAGQPIALKAGVPDVKFPTLSKARTGLSNFKESNSDAIWGVQTAMTGVQAYQQFAGSDDAGPTSAGDMGILANNQLVDSADQGGLFNPSSPTWSFDSSVSALQNSTNAQNTWNNNYGLPQGFNSMNSPGYGWTYQQWLQQQMAS